MFALRIARPKELPQWAVGHQKEEQQTRQVSCSDRRSQNEVHPVFNRRIASDQCPPRRLAPCSPHNFLCPSTPCSVADTKRDVQSTGPTPTPQSRGEPVPVSPQLLRMLPASASQVPSEPKPPRKLSDAPCTPSNAKRLAPSSPPVLSIPQRWLSRPRIMHSRTAVPAPPGLPWKS